MPYWGEQYGNESCPKVDNIAERNYANKYRKVPVALRAYNREAWTISRVVKKGGQE